MEIESGVVRRDDPRYPSQLLNIVPEVKELWYRGKWRKELFAKCVAVVGARKISRYGKQVIEELAPILVENGYTVVSGFMYGVDIEMHSKVIVNGGRTIGVLGHGIDYPIDAQHYGLYHKFLEGHGIFIAETKDLAPKQFRYLLRNRIVVGLAEMVFVIEAGEKSGSLNSAMWARKLGRKVWAVPGSIDSKVSEGTNGLISRGEAEMFTWNGLDEYLQNTSNKSYSRKGAKDRTKMKLTSSERQIITLLTLEGPQSVNEISRFLKIPAGQIIPILTDLYVKGRVTCDRGLWTC